MEQKRFVGIDLGKRTYEIKFINENGNVNGTNGVTSPAGRKALYKKLRSTDRVAIEVCSLAMVMAKEIEKEVGCEVVLLNPSQIALIYRSLKKNDKEDALKLARLVQKYTNEELPKVELPSEHEENIRQILTELRQLKHDSPGMYIGKLGDGSSHDDGIYVLLKEVIDNSIDEFMQGHGRSIGTENENSTDMNSCKFS